LNISNRVHGILYLKVQGKEDKPRYAAYWVQYTRCKINIAIYLNSYVYKNG